MSDEKKIEQFKYGIFNLGTNFGELAQLMIKELEKFTPADGKYFDLLDSNSQKIEVKFSRAKKKLKPLKKSKIIELCLNSASDSRMLTEAEATNITFDCNIQQIKPSEFDILYYGIFFKDKIVIFKVQSDDIPDIPGYSIQHKGGTEYQFHINKSNYAKHKKKHFYKELTYTQLLAVCEKE